LSWIFIPESPLVRVGARVGSPRTGLAVEPDARWQAVKVLSGEVLPTPVVAASPKNGEEQQNDDEDQ
jgi:hypothetical protein